jgi:hypothetical protein
LQICKGSKRSSFFDQSINDKEKKSFIKISVRAQAVQPKPVVVTTVEPKPVFEPKVDAGNEKFENGGGGHFPERVDCDKENSYAGEKSDDEDVIVNKSVADSGPVWILPPADEEAKKKKKKNKNKKKIAKT